MSVCMIFVFVVEFLLIDSYDNSHFYYIMTIYFYISTYVPFLLVEEKMSTMHDFFLMLVVFLHCILSFACFNTV